MHKIVHFAMLHTTKYCSRIQVKTHSTMLAINLCKQTTHMGYNSNFTAVKKRLRCEWGVWIPKPLSGYATGF